MASMTDTNIPTTRPSLLTLIGQFFQGLSKGHAAGAAAQSLAWQDAERREDQIKAFYLKHFG